LSPSGIEHYENFPVASVLVPARIRPAVLAIYRFARAADDIADEGDASTAERLKALSTLREDLERLYSTAAPQVPEVAQLAQAVHQHGLCQRHFSDLLSAFSQDLEQKSYATFTELNDYCNRSANPVGRLMLELMGVVDPVAITQSDEICTALQLINFWQDVAIDLKKSRIYIPVEDMQRFGVSPSAIYAHQVDPAWQALMAFQVQRARALMRSGAPLLNAIHGRMRLEIAFTVAGGLRILDRIEAVHYDVFNYRPKLSWRDGPALVRTAISLL
jgi:squalene synthase HpnC